MKSKRRIWREVAIHGTAISPGIAIGQAFVFKPYNINLSELEIQVENTKHEVSLFTNARKKVQEQLDYAQTVSETNYSDQFAEIFESQKAFLNDPVLINEIEEKILHSKNSAAYVVSKVLSEKSEHFIKLENTYFKERAYDILDLQQKLINALLGIDIDYQLNNPSIVVADMLSPSDTVNFNKNLILGFMTDRGGITSHAAILARGLRIPAVVNGINLSRILQNNDPLIVDGFSGTVILNPSASTISYYKKLQRKQAQIQKQLESEIKLKTVTPDGHSVKIMANLEFANEINYAKKNNAQGIGLFRTESIFIKPDVEPNEENQYLLYKSLAEQIRPSDIIIRTIDLGGDKMVEGYTEADEPNPFLGWRAIRFCLDRKDIFKTQLRAIYRASVHGSVKILIPMISSIQEIIETKNLIEKVKNELESQKIPFISDIPLGIMVETPATAVSAGIFAKYADFFSIGTNDLTQYTLAIDRTNDKVARSYNPFNPAVLMLIEKTIKEAVKRGIEVSLCGEFSAVPEAVPLLLGMGLRIFSMTPFFIPEVKKIVRSLAVKDCEKLWNKVKRMHQEEQIESECHQFIKYNVPELFALKEEN
ncbi:MAG: phosphoenolpyruvate--protein phosphotransferase [Calditrichaceae bacterium]|nr:phosphoenolpyruvate--protein phosphotransferase [Calditrichaceae bacterium]